MIIIMGLIQNKKIIVLSGTVRMMRNEERIAEIHLF